MAMITLCVPTKNRPLFLERTLRYYAQQRFAHWILIGDSSDPAHAEENRRRLELFRPHLRVEHRAYPGLSSCAAMEQLSREVATPYCVFLGDDDYLCPRALERCAAFLDQHADHSAAHGQAVIFQTEGNRPYGAIGNVRAYPQAVIDEVTGAARLKEFFTRSLFAVLYSVHRTSTWRDMLRGLSTLPGVQNANVFKDELIATSVSVIRGKVADLEGLYLVRQVHETSYRFPHVYDWLTSPDWFPSYVVFRDRLTDELMRQDRLDRTATGTVIAQAFWPYLAHEISVTWQREQQRGGITREPSRVREWARDVPWLRQGWRALRALRQRVCEEYSLPALLSPSSPHRDDFLPIYQLMTSAPQIRPATSGRLERHEDAVTAGV